MASARVPDRLVRSIVAAAVHAPSVHNTQPWRWRARGRGIELYADRSRQLPVLDPTGRQLHLSCGAALLHARVAAVAAGARPHVRLLPTPSDPDHLATLELDGAEADDVAAGSAAPDEPDETQRRLAAVIELRHTHRDPFADRLDPAVVERLRAAADAEHAVLHPVTAGDDLAGLAVVVAEADAVERADPAYRAELERWVRPAGDDADDGVPVEALPHPAPGTWVTALQPRDFRAVGPPTPGPGVPPRVEHPLAAVLVTDGDDPVDWLHAGQALARVFLELTDAGGAAQPLNQPLDVPRFREQVRRRLRLLGYPQMLLRLGTATSQVRTPRRHVDDVLTT